MFSNDGQPTERLEALLLSHKIDVDEVAEDYVVPMSKTLSIFTEHAAQIDNEFHGASDIRLKAGATDLIVARVLLSKTMIDVFRAFSDAWKVLVSNTSVSVMRRETGISLKWIAADPANQRHQIFVEAMAVIFYGVFNWMSGASLHVLKVNVAKSRQQSTSDSLHLLGAPVFYSGDSLELIFAPEIAELEVLDVQFDIWREIGRASCRERV